MSQIYYSFEAALEANYALSEEQQKQVLLFCYYHKNDFPIPMHSHGFYEINIITGGTGTHFIEGNSFAIKSGDFFLIPPNIQHGYSETEELSIFHIIFSDRFFDKYHNVLRSIHGYSLLFNIEPQLRAKSNLKIFPSIAPGDFRYFLGAIERLYKLNQYTDFMPETEKCLKTLDLICDFAALVTGDKYTDSAHSFVDIQQITKVLSYIEKNYSSKITLVDLCKLSNMSRSTLLGQFHALTGSSPTDYTAQVRIDNARKMLVESDRSIATVAQDCGFYDSAHFTKVFFQRTGKLPKDYRHESKQ